MSRRATRWIVAAVAVAVLAVATLVACGAPSLEPYAPWFDTAPSPPEDQMTVRFMGTSTVSFDDGVTRILIDGFFSRPSIGDALGLSPNDARIEHALREARLADLAAIFVAHSHYDHAMDSARVARRTGAVVVGSSSTAWIARGDDLAEHRIRIIERDGPTFAFGQFTVTPIVSPHTNPVRLKGEITRPVRPPASIFQYREGGSYSFLVRHGDCRILVVPSTSYTDGIFEGVQAQTVFLGMAELADQGFAAKYWERAVRNTGARLVIPVHWDDFTRPLDEALRPFYRPLDSFVANMRVLTGLAEADRGKVELRLPVAFKPITLPRDPGGRTICAKARTPRRTP
jgi:L-ascorbate metabolism protein UlaG (beta-lactamase superfamily)